MKLKAITCKAVWFAVVEVFPVRTVSDVVEVPARRQDHAVSLGGDETRVVLPALKDHPQTGVLPHLNNRVAIRLKYTRDEEDESEYAKLYVLR